MNNIIASLTWQRVPADAITFKNLQKESIQLLSYAVFYVLVAILSALLIKAFPIPILQAGDFIQDFWYAIVFKLFFLLIIPVWVYFKIWKYSIKDLLLGLQAKRSVIFKGTLLILLGFFLNTKHIQPILLEIPNFSDTGIRLIIGILLPLFIAGIPEELFFRGLLQTRLEKLTHPILAIFISGILFTAWHIPSRFFLANGVDGTAGDLPSVLVGTGIPVFIVGTFFGWHWMRYRNLPLLILVHWAIDILPSVSSFFRISY